MYFLPSTFFFFFFFLKFLFIRKKFNLLVKVKVKVCFHSSIHSVCTVCVLVDLYGDYIVPSGYYVRVVLPLAPHFYIHLSNVLTDHFSNSLSEKTTNDIPMKFIQCHFKTTSYRLQLPNRGIYLKIIHVRRKAIFMFFRSCIACINTITFQIGYFTRQ